MERFQAVTTGREPSASLRARLSLPVQHSRHTVCERALGRGERVVGQDGTYAMQDEEDQLNDQSPADDTPSAPEDQPQPGKVGCGNDGDDGAAPAEAPQADSAPATDETSAAGQDAVPSSDNTDAVAVSDKPPEKQEPVKTGPVDWSQETSAHAIEVELQHIETSVRTALETVDSRRKRRLGGTQRWRELEQDISSWRFTGRFSEEAAQHLLYLIRKRHSLYERLSFLSSTRPTWNT